MDTILWFRMQQMTRRAFTKGEMCVGLMMRDVMLTCRVQLYKCIRWCSYSLVLFATQFRPLRVRVVFLIATALVMASSFVFVAKGLTNVSSAALTIDESLTVRHLNYIFHLFPFKSITFSHGVYLFHLHIIITDNRTNT